MNPVIIFLNNLSFKKVIFFSFVFSLVLSVPLISFLIKNETTIFSSASNRPEQKQILDESLVPYPKEPPVISQIEKFYGKSGDSIVILGKNFADAQKESFVYIGNFAIPKENTLYWSDSEVEVILPSLSGIYNVKISVNNKSSVWDYKLNVYNELTTESILVDEKNNFIRVFDPTLSLTVYSIKGNVGVLGTQNFKNESASTPVDLASSNIISVLVYKNGVLVPYKVANPK